MPRDVCGGWNAQLADLSSRYTPNHPDVRRIKEKITAAEILKQRLEADAASGKSQPSVASADNRDSSRVSQAGRQFEDSRPKIAYREREIKKLEKQIEAYQSHLNMTPLREQQLVGGQVSGMDQVSQSQAIGVVDAVLVADEDRAVAAGEGAQAAHLDHDLAARRPVDECASQGSDHRAAGLPPTGS